MSDSVRPHGRQHARLPVLHYLLVCSDSCPLSWWCHPTISSFVIPCPPAFNLSEHQGLFQWVGSWNQMSEVLELQFQHQCFQWVSELIPLLRPLKFTAHWIFNHHCGSWNLSLQHVGARSSTRDGTGLPTLGVQSLSHWTTGKILHLSCLSQAWRIHLQFLGQMYYFMSVYTCALPSAWNAVPFSQWLNTLHLFSLLQMSFSLPDPRTIPWFDHLDLSYICYYTV